jgi:hypothetical protein
MSIIDRARPVIHRHRYHLADVGVILATFAFVAVVGTVGLLVLHEALRH